MVNIYADTSVIGGCFDLEFQEWSKALFEEFRSGAKKIIISDLVSLELEAASSDIKAILNEVPIENRIYISENLAAERLAEVYIKEGALTNKSFNDALHIAHATLNNADVLASWNFKHIVNLDRIKLYNAINRKLGYCTLEIRTPREILKTITYEKVKKFDAVQEVRSFRDKMGPIYMNDREKLRKDLKDIRDRYFPKDCNKKQDK